MRQSAQPQPASRRRIAQGRVLSELESSMAGCIEGVSSIEAVLALAARHHIELPICETVAAVLAGTATPHDAVASLMGRAATVELQDLERRTD